MGIRQRIASAFLWAFLLTIAIPLFQPCALGAEGEEATGVPVVILRVEGDGIAKVKKAIGTEEVAGANGKVYPGDRVITDEKSTVFLMINDGSVIKVGLSSEFKVEQAKLHERFMVWAFGLMKGSMRAMVEKNPNPDVRFKINTPSGTIGVRGTEFVVALDDDAKTSYLYTIEGLVSYGTASCETSNSCIDVRAGESSSMKVGESRPSKPQVFQSKDLFGIGAANAKPGITDNRMSLFRDAKKVTARYMQDTDDLALKKLVNEASEAMAMSQDQALGRSKEERVAMQAEIKSGTWNDTMAAADAYSKQNEIFDPAVNGGAENLVGQTVAAKFRLGRAVKEAVEVGVYPAPKDETKDPKMKWEKADLTKMRKNVGYEQAEKAKEAKEKLKNEAEDYNKVLELAEAHPAKPVETIGADAIAVEPKAASQEMQDKQEKAVLPACNKACEAKSVSEQMNALSEGVTAAFNDKPGAKNDDEPTPGRLTRKDRGLLKSKYFKKSIPGNACYNEVKDCKLIPCRGASKGRKCKRGESVKECTTKKTQVRCRDKK